MTAMDPYGRIYMDDDEKIPPEDKARLDGYLRGRAEADKRLVDEEKMAELRGELEALEARKGKP
jgi:hypothetical protein